MEDGPSEEVIKLAEESIKHLRAGKNDDPHMNFEKNNELDLEKFNEDSWTNISTQDIERDLFRIWMYRGDSLTEDLRTNAEYKKGGWENLNEIWNKFEDGDYFYFKKPNTTEISDAEIKPFDKIKFVLNGLKNSDTRKNYEKWFSKDIKNQEDYAWFMALIIEQHYEDQKAIEEELRQASRVSTEGGTSDLIAEEEEHEEEEDEEEEDEEHEEEEEEEHEEEEDEEEEDEEEEDEEEEDEEEDEEEEDEEEEDEEHEEEHEEEEDEEEDDLWDTGLEDSVLNKPSVIANIKNSPLQFRRVKDTKHNLIENGNTVHGPNMTKFQLAEHYNLHRADVVNDDDEHSEIYSVLVFPDEENETSNVGLFDDDYDVNDVIGAESNYMLVIPDISEWPFGWEGKYRLSTTQDEDVLLRTLIETRRRCK